MHPQKTIQNIKSFNLRDQRYGLYMPPTIWYETIYQGNNNSILVITDSKYIEKDYIRDRDDFIKFRLNYENKKNKN